MKNQPGTMQKPGITSCDKHAASTDLWNEKVLILKKEIPTAKELDLRLLGKVIIFVSHAGSQLTVGQSDHFSCHTRGHN